MRLVRIQGAVDFFLQANPEDGSLGVAVPVEQISFSIPASAVAATNGSPESLTDLVLAGIERERAARRTAILLPTGRHEKFRNANGVV